MIVVSHPTGNANVRATLRAFQKRGLLARFYTTLAWQSRSGSRLIPSSISAELDRRSYKNISKNLIETRVRRELPRHILEKLRFTSWYVHEDAPFSIDSVYRDLDEHVSRQLLRLKDVDTVYAYEDGALATFKSATALGLRRVYDLPIGYWKASREMAKEEAIVSPEWAMSLSALSDSERKCERKERELDSANVIVVASQFTKRSLQLFQGFDERKVFVIPYGAPMPQTKKKKISEPGKPLKALYVGSLSQRKGLSYLAEAMKALGKSVDLTLVGKPTVPTPVPVTKMCRDYHWIPSLPHADLLELMSQHDVLVFPSLFEGFGLVILEALSRGLPVITTSNTGGPDVLREGMDGFIVPIRSGAAIASCLQKLVDDRDLLEQMSRSALQRAAMLSWSNFEDLLYQSVCNEIGLPS